MNEYIGNIDPQEALEFCFEHNLQVEFDGGCVKLKSAYVDMDEILNGTLAGAIAEFEDEYVRSESKFSRKDIVKHVNRGDLYVIVGEPETKLSVCNLYDEAEAYRVGDFSEPETKRFDHEQFEKFGEVFVNL